MARALILTATLHVAGNIIDSSADGWRVDDAVIVYETGEFPKCLKNGGTWAHAEPIGDGVEVLRGVGAIVIPLPDSEKKK